MNTLILAIGNTLLQDEGVGNHLLQRLIKEKPHWPVTYLDGGTLSFSIAKDIEQASHLIILDAANLKQQAGSIQLIVDDDLDSFLSKPGKSVHEVSLGDLFDMTRLTETLPEHRAMIAIQPKNIDWGEQLSAEVEQALDIAIDKIEEILLNWQVLPQTNPNRTISELSNVL